MLVFIIVIDALFTILIVRGLVFYRPGYLLGGEVWTCWTFCGLLDLVCVL